jgi:hypothetical protein
MFALNSESPESRPRQPFRLLRPTPDGGGMSAYVPRSGSKVELAVNFLKHGPKSAEQLALALEVKRSNVSVLLNPACRHGFLVQFRDDAGVAHWGLARGAADGEGQGRSRTLAEWPLVRNIVTHAPPSEEARRYADPFGRTKGW